MKGYVFISEKRSSVNTSPKQVREMLEKYNGILDLRIRKSKIESNQVALFTFTNEPEEIKYSYGKYEFATSGDFLKEESKVFEAFINAKNKNQYISNLGGINTFAAFYDNKFTVWNNVTRVEPVYWAETNERIVVGTRAILVHLLAFGTETPIYEPLAMGSFLNSGFYADESTPYKGLNIVGINKRLELQNDTISIQSIDDFEDKLYSITPTSEIYDDLTETFLNSFSFLKKLDLPLTIGLTGGKDSRLIAAGLNYLGLNFKTKTTGFETTPDVLVAKRIANELNLEHQTVIPAAGKEKITFDLYQRTINTIRNTEGMVYAYENVGSVAKGFNSSNILLGGQGGAFVKGGYSKAFNIKEDESVEEFMIRTFIKHPEFINKKAIHQYKEFIKEDLLSHSANLNRDDILNLFYLTHRGGRWTSSSRPYYTSRGYTYSAFFENQLVKKSQMIETEHGKNEEIIYNILKRIAPNLIEIPFADDRWQFEKSHPYHRYSLKQWIAKQPIQATTKLSGFNWRKNLLQTSKAELEEVILGNDDSPLFDVVNKEQVKRLFSQPVHNGKKYDTLLWSMYTASLLLSNEWYEKPTNKSKISIKIPKSESKKVSGIIEEIRHIPNTLLESRHEDLLVENKDDLTSVIKWGKFDSSVMYCQLFDGNFTTPPSKEYAKYSKIRGTRARFSFEVDKILPNNIELDLYFMQYNDEKRIKSEARSFYITEAIKMYTIEVPILPGTINYKIAFRVSRDTIPGEFMVNQMRIEFIN